MRKTLKVVAFGGDPADAFLKAAGITDSTITSAVKTLVRGLQADGLWSKMKAIYPMVGGNATSHSYNLKNPSQFQITWNGGLTHSSTGVLPNGTTGYGNTNFNPFSNSSLNSKHYSYYSRTTSNNLEVEIGNKDSIYNSFVEIRTLGVTYYQLNTGAGTNINFTDSDSKGFYIANRTASNIINGWKNSTKQVTGSTTALNLPNSNIYLGAFNNNGSALYYSTKECAFATIGDGLSDTEAANLYTSIQKFQTTLNRFVGTPIPEPYILDSYSGASAAYSLRQLSSTYTGNAIRVRRASDNAEQNIGFVNRVLDTASLESFCSGTNGFVTTWYDQSGNGSNATQTTAASQPQIVSSGSVLTQNSKPTIKYDGTNDYLGLSFNNKLISSYSVFNKATANFSEYNGIYSHRVNNYTIGSASNENGGFVGIQGTNKVFSIIDPNASYVNNVYIPSNFKSSNNTGETLPNSTSYNLVSFYNTSSVSGTKNVYLGVDNYNISRCLNGNIAEIIFYPTDMSSSNSNINTLINSYYSIY